jgi:hypothetical protein
MSAMDGQRLTSAGDRQAPRADRLTCGCNDRPTWLTSRSHCGLRPAPVPVRLRPLAKSMQLCNDSGRAAPLLRLALVPTGASAALRSSHADQICCIVSFRQNDFDRGRRTSRSLDVADSITASAIVSRTEPPAVSLLQLTPRRGHTQRTPLGLVQPTMKRTAVVTVGPPGGPAQSLEPSVK